MFFIMETVNAVVTMETMATVVTVVIVEIMIKDKAEGIVNYVLDCAGDLSNIIKDKQYGIDDIVDP